jgi:PPK2 family polyphosphate:nucleotide phosphotransferase
MGKQALSPDVGDKIDLDDFDANYTGKFTDDEEAKRDRDKHIEKLHDIQEVFYAEQKHSLLVVFQAMDTAGKDGVIEHVFRGLNPQGVHVASFKKPTDEELGHDFLWRIHPHTPRKGMITVFNRSHYEDVLVTRVRDLVPKKVWKKRYDHINHFEELLHDHGTTILKFFLHISKDEQKRRLESRRDTPRKQWKFLPADIEERQYWDDYMDAYAEAISKTNTAHAPWHIVPANHKWYRDYVVTKTILNAMEAMDCKYNIASITIPD